MKRIYVDFNAREVGADQVAVAVPKAEMSDHAGGLAEGLHVIFYDEETECEAVLRRGGFYPWVGDVVSATVRTRDEMRHSA